VTLDLAAAARQLLASEGDASATTADRVARACERMTVHLARLVGLTGIQTLFHRSVVLSSAKFPWLVDEAGGRGGPGEDQFEELRERLAPQDPDAAVGAFILVLSTFVGLLGRLIGEELVWRLLHEVWPAVFPDAVKETS
jgi:hypothetical protein